MRDINLNNYRQIRAQERINLTISALARGDIKEADRLYDTCPTYCYKIADHEFNGQLQAIYSIIDLFFWLCFCYYRNAAKLDSELQPEDKSQKSLDEKIIRKFENRNSNICSLKALYQGFREFCQQVGIEAEEVLKIMDIKRYCPDIQTYLDFDHTDPPDPDEIERFKDMFLGYWGL